MPPRGAAARRSATRALAGATFMALAFQSLGAQDRQIAAADSSVRAASWNDVLSRIVSVRVTDVTIEIALRAVAQRGALRLSYSSDIIPPDRRVTVARDSVAAGDVIREILRDTDLDVVVSPAGYVVIVRLPWSRWSESPTSAASDTSEDVTRRAIGRSTIRTQLMDRILVMGTPAAGAPERELASAVSVLTTGQIAQQGPLSMKQLFRTGIPGVVSWDLGIAGPFAQIGSVRGSSSFTSNYLKTYVDGVELASPYLLFAIDPFSVERIEVIRGPQGSAMYGSDAISGVVQVVTRKGTPSAQWRPQVDAAFSGGRMESRYVEGGSAVQRHSGMLFSGGGSTSLGLGGTFESVGAIAPGGDAGYRGTYGGGRTLLGPFRLEGTMRYADVRFTAPANPLFRDLSITSTLRPLLESQRIENETYGVTADFQPRSWWRQTIIVGMDRHSGSIPPQREPATVADALLGATRERASKTSVRYSMAVRLLSLEAASLTATAGAERADLTRERLGVSAELIGSGAGLASLYNDRIRNTGLFGQIKLDLANSLFLTAGLRGERNSSFGESYRTAYAPMLGVAFTRDVSGATLKLRTAYGKGIRPPPPSARRAIQTVGFRQIANPALEPEVQSGIEAGVELYAGDRASLSLTSYSQNAEGLIQQVIPNPNLNARTVQYQNVGRILNRGVELEGSARAGSLRADVSFALTESRVSALSPTYTGDLRVNDRVPEVPNSSGLASVTWERSRVRATAGASYIGEWTGYNWLDYYSAELGAIAGRPSLRNFWVDYPSVTKPFLGLAYTMVRGAEWYLRVDNLSNQQRNERDDLQITQGRTTTLGLRLTR